MFRIHCNHCFRLRDAEPSVVFHMSQCQHIFCNTCFTELSAESKCAICKRQLKAVPISRDMPRSFGDFFEDPLRFLELYRKVSKFQNRQRTSDNLGFYRRLQKHEKQKLQLKGYCKLEAQLNQKIQKEKKCIEQLRTYIKYYEDAAEKKRRPTIDKKSHGSELKATWGNQFHRPRPRTPSVNTSEHTQSDEYMTTFFLDSDMEGPAEDQSRPSGQKSFNL
ncbi:RING finger protein nenya [Drosophila biarmipes]|uniref:RING finger protein nenya n=1 Tax=Drosophila biarmipes TaxID=125945 RepID=UPI0007E88C23|nr:RING finger protein nenya [Drosophila biarmipes]